MLMKLKQKTKITWDKKLYTTYIYTTTTTILSIVDVVVAQYETVLETNFFSQLS